MASDKKSIEKLKSIHALGVIIAIDDFGTGYSSMSYLKRYPIDKLKIDRSFVSDLPGDTENTAITKAIIAMAQSLNMVTVAEGVETSQQFDFLDSLGCNYFQGFYFGRPMSAQAITELLNKKLPDEATLQDD